MAEALRLFVALELPPTVLAALAAAQESLLAAVPPRAARWTRTEGIHLTLKFLGETPPAAVDSLQAALQTAAADHAPLALRTDGLGCFPNMKRPRVVWAGVGGDEAGLRALHAAVEAALLPLGHARDTRAFSPHLTLGRVRREASSRDAQAVGVAVAQAPAGEAVAWTADALSLMQSELRPDGARYTCLAAFPLA